MARVPRDIGERRLRGLFSRIAARERAADDLTAPTHPHSSVAVAVAVALQPRHRLCRLPPRQRVQRRGVVRTYARRSSGRRCRRHAALQRRVAAVGPTPLRHHEARVVLLPVRAACATINTPRWRVRGLPSRGGCAATQLGQRRGWWSRRVCGTWRHARVAARCAAARHARHRRRHGGAVRSRALRVGAAATVCRCRTAHRSSARSIRRQR